MSSRNSRNKITNTSSYIIIIIIIFQEESIFSTFLKTISISKCIHSKKSIFSSNYNQMFAIHCKAMRNIDKLAKQLPTTGLIKWIKWQPRSTNQRRKYVCTMPFHCFIRWPLQRDADGNLFTDKNDPAMINFFILNKNSLCNGLHKIWTKQILLRP